MRVGDLSPVEIRCGCIFRIVGEQDIKEYFKENSNLDITKSIKELYDIWLHDQNANLAIANFRVFTNPCYIEIYSNAFSNWEIKHLADYTINVIELGLDDEIIFHITKGV